MRVTTKGQVTIPQDVREKLGVHPGSEVEFSIEGNGAKLIPTRPSLRGRRIVERLRGTGTVRLTTDEIMALTRGEA